MANNKNSLNKEDIVDNSNIDQINNFVTGTDDENGSKEYSETRDIESIDSNNSNEEVDLLNEDEEDPDTPEDKLNNDESEESVKEKPLVQKKSSNQNKPQKESNNTNKKKIEQKHLSESKSKQIKTPHRNSDKKEKTEIISKKEPVKYTQKKNDNKESKKMDKKSEKHTKHSKEDNKSSKTKNIIMWTVIGILAIVLIVALILLTKNNSKTETQTGNTSINTSIAATVNGDPIYMSDILNEYNKLNPLMQRVYTPEMVLNKTIDDILLYQEAVNRGIKVTDEDVEAELDALKKANMLSDEELKLALEKQGLTIEEVKILIKKNLYVQELINKTILKDIEVTDKEIQTYYTENINQFKTADKVTVQHILVMITDKVTDAQAKEKMDKINAELTNDNFCDLVTKYSEDPGSVANCGKYTFAKGDFNNPEFENPSFDLKIGEKAVVKTVFGYHLIKKLETIPAETKELKEVKTDIDKIITDAKAQEKFDILLTKLREEAVIVNYMNKVAETTTSATTTTASTTTKTSTQTVSKESKLDTFAKCLTENGAKFYGASWCPHCNNQKELFGDSMKYVTYVECAVEGQPQIQTKECTDAEIEGYPTWVVNGKKYPGEQTLERLADLTDCTLN